MSAPVNQEILDKIKKLLKVDEGVTSRNVLHYSATVTSTCTASLSTSTRYVG